MVIVLSSGTSTVAIFQVEEGRVTEMRYFTDLVTTLTAIGAIPPME